MKMKLQLARLFTGLKNTGTASYFAEKGRSYRTPPFLLNYREVSDINNSCRSRIALWKRHPDLGLIDDWDVEYPLLQVRGTWSKFDLKTSIGPLKRRGGVTWIWRSKLYVFGGARHKDQNQVESYPVFDIWLEFFFFLSIY